jgi:hypothetical protein
MEFRLSFYGGFDLKSLMNAKLRSFILKCPDLLAWYAGGQKVFMVIFDGLHALAKRFIHFHASKFCIRI